MKYRISHTTTYQYSENVSLSQNHARLTPQNSMNQRCLQHHIDISPTPDFIAEFSDYFRNMVYVFEVPLLHKELKITAASEVEITPRQQTGLFEHQLAWEGVRDELANPSSMQAMQASEFCLNTPTTRGVEAIRDYAKTSFTAGRPMIEACEDLTSRIFHEFHFDPSFSTINTPVTDVFEHKRGVCQDFAHFALTCLRSVGLACKYVSGYIETLPPPGQEKLTGADATHAWVSVYVPGLGWLDFDPTNNLMPHDQHIVLATGRDFNDVTPLKGVMFGGGANQLSVAVDMNRIDGE